MNINQQDIEKCMVSGFFYNEENARKYLERMAKMKKQRELTDLEIELKCLKTKAAIDQFNTGITATNYEEIDNDGEELG